MPSSRNHSQRSFPTSSDLQLSYGRMMTMSQPILKILWPKSYILQEILCRHSRYVRKMKLLHALVFLQLFGSFRTKSSFPSCFRFSMKRNQMIASSKGQKMKLQEEYGSIQYSLSSEAKVPNDRSGCIPYTL